MVADSDEELHEMAGKLGLRREVFTGSHVYSIPHSAMEQALSLGAKQVERSVILGKLRR